MKILLNNLLVAFAMYSRLPVPKADWEEDNMKYCICFFPLIGLISGLLVNVTWRLLLLAGAGNAVQGSVLAVIPILVTGGIHMDGFLDTSDAIGSWKSVEEKLEIMKDSHSGASAVICGLCYMALYAGAMASMNTKALLLTGVGFMLSRAYSGFGLIVLRKAKKTGLLRSFSDRAASQRCSRVMIVWIAVSTAVMIMIDPVSGAVCAGCALAVFLWYRWTAYSKFGGITGDLAGYFLQICELVIALAAVLVCK